MRGGLFDLSARRFDAFSPARDLTPDKFGSGFDRKSRQFSVPLRFSSALGLSVMALTALFRAATTLLEVPFGTQNPTKTSPQTPGYPSSVRLGQLGRGA